jgi:hypothetical protein
MGRPALPYQDRAVEIEDQPDQAGVPGCAIHFGNDRIRDRQGFDIDRLGVAGSPVQVEQFRRQAAYGLIIGQADACLRLGRLTRWNSNAPAALPQSAVVDQRLPSRALLTVKRTMAPSSCSGQSEAGTQPLIERSLGSRRTKRSTNRRTPASGHQHLCLARCTLAITKTCHRPPPGSLPARSGPDSTVGEPFRSGFGRHGCAGPGDVIQARSALSDPGRTRSLPSMTERSPPC